MPSSKTPAQNLLLKQLRAAPPAGLPADVVNSKTVDGLIRRGLAEKYVTTRTVTLEMVRLTGEQR